MYFFWEEHHSLLELRNTKTGFRFRTTLHLGSFKIVMSPIKSTKMGKNVALAGNAALGDSDFSLLCSCLQMTAKALQALIWDHK